MSYEGSVLHRIQKLDTANQVNFINNEQLHVEYIKFIIINKGLSEISERQIKITNLYRKIGHEAEKFNIQMSKYI